MKCTYAATAELEREYAEVAGKAFNRPSQMREHKLEWMKRPRYRHEHTRIVVDDGRVVAGVAIVELPVHFGDTILKLGGISCVATDPDTQKKGYGRANMEDTVAYMEKAGYDISFLLGIKNYYHRYGYRTALTWFACRFGPTEYTATPAPGLRVRPARKSDIPGMADIYEKTLANCDLSVVRERKDWLWYFEFGRFAGAHVVVDNEKRIVGYFSAKPGGKLRIDEIAVEDQPAVYETVLAFFRDMAKENFASTIEVYTPYGSGFAKYCLFKKRLSWVRWTDFEGGPMLRLLNTERLFEKIAPTLKKRWAHAHDAATSGTVTLKFSGGSVAFLVDKNGLAVTPGTVAGTIVTIPDEALTELVLGFRPVRDILSDAGATAPDAAVSVLESVFPESVPFMPPTDHM